jgi:protein XagA
VLRIRFGGIFKPNAAPPPPDVLAGDGPLPGRLRGVGTVFKRCVAVVLALCCMPSVGWAGAWTLPEGTGDLLASLTATTASEYFTGGRLTPTPRYSKEELALLIEYGLTDRLTAIFIPGLQNIDIAAPTNAERFGLNYTEFGARYAFFQQPDWVISGQATLRIPGTTDTANPAAIGYTDVEADFRALVGHSFSLSGFPAFIDLEAAERWRTDGYPSEVHFDGTLGLQVTRQWLLLLQGFNVVSEGSGLSLFGGSYAYCKVELSAVYRLTPTMALQFGALSTYAGSNALQENGVVLAFWHQF